jgi:VIT1/CCC1 family predicted Fe2+/Mn2+ transporter
VYDPPRLLELVDAVREFLERQALPKLEGRTAFHARVAVNALAIIERQLRLGPDAERAELERLRALLGQDGNLDELNRALCARIRDGVVGMATPGLRAHLRETTLAKLAVDQPKYSGYLRALGRSPAEPT